MAARIPDDERQQIITVLQSGQSLTATAKQFTRSKGTIFNIAQQAGISLERSATNKASAARKDYNQANRLLLINEFFDKAHEMLHGIELNPLGLQQMATALAILVDKRRLEDGEATSRSEVHDDSNRARLSGRLDELAARRTARVDQQPDRRTG